ncbi:copper homeostasis protein CutC, partial [uncultured Nitratireductor sp.]|uniref:copper homeostasis protein CutC n=1 Tax=uncultured Nitratireductor sp. TaxID=520953 RepID=UPI0025D973CB
ALPLGGLTPSHGLMRAAAGCGVPAYAMIRPRQGDFRFGEREVALMVDDIAAARDAGLSGVVLGAATVGGGLDEGALALLYRASEGMGRTLHRVIDTVENRRAAIDAAIALGFERILTSGGALTAMDGLEALAEMRAHAGERIEIMAGSGVAPENAGNIANRTGIRAFHASCGTSVPVDPRLGALGFSPPTERRTSVEKIVEMKAALERL